MIIPKEEVEKAIKNFGNSGVWQCPISFKAGIEFLEEYVQKHVQDIITENQGLKLYKDNEAERFKNLSIEFYSWMRQYQDLSAAIRINEVENSQELFDKFIKERNETNS